MTAVVSPADASAKLLDVQAVAEMLGCSPSCEASVRKEVPHVGP